MKDTILDGELVLDTPLGSNPVRSSCTHSVSQPNAMVTVGPTLLGV
jgi:hypothetical protein